VELELELELELVALSVKLTSCAEELRLPSSTFLYLG
jgi:hypothetical protein